jgi:hypothetical protein
MLAVLDRDSWQMRRASPAFVPVRTAINAALASEWSNQRRQAKMEKRVAW